MIRVDLNLCGGRRHDLEEVGRVVVTEVDHNLALRNEMSPHCSIARVGESVGLYVKSSNTIAAERRGRRVGRYRTGPSRAESRSIRGGIKGRCLVPLHHEVGQRGASIVRGGADLNQQ